METAQVPCMLQCDEPCNLAMGIIDSIERWESIRQKVLHWKGLDKFGSVHECVDWVKGSVGHFIHDSYRLTLSNASCSLHPWLRLAPKTKLQLPRGYDQVYG